MTTMGDILHTVGCSVPWREIMSTVGVILNTLGVFSTMGGYHEYRGGCSVPCGKKSFAI